MTPRAAFVAALAALVLAGGVVAYAVQGSGAAPDVTAAPSPSATATSVASTPTPTETRTPSPTPTETQPSPSPSPSPSSSPSPTFSYDVAAVQEQLRDLGYYGGSIDGEPGAMLRSAVMAFQKVNGLSADGIVGPVTLEALENPARPVLKASGPSTRIEIDLGTQVLFYVENGRLARIMPVSSGNGEKYRHVSGSTATALTPVGWFEIERKISGLREAPLGSLYDPMYFYRGWAIHGSNSVPAYPASHGCVRLPRWDAVWLFGRVPTGTDVFLYGGVHTFTAGSSAPGTSEPAGDTASDSSSPTPSESPSPSDSPSRSPSQSPSQSPSEDSSQSPSDEPSQSPSQSPSDSSSPSPESSTSPSPSASESEPDPIPTGDSG